MQHDLKTTIPEVRINFSYLLYGCESPVLDRHVNGGKDTLASPSHYKELTRSYRAAWERYETILLRDMQTILGVAFYRPVIDVSLAPYFVPHSDPLIINFRYEPDEFVDILTHELLHVLLTDNSVHQSNSRQPKMNLLQEWRSLFGDHANLVLAHIPVHALHKSLCLHTLKAPERLERDVSRAQQSPTGAVYAEAWDYVNTHDYLGIIDQLRLIYRDTSSK
jgi:hypothetical protein